MLTASAPWTDPNRDRPVLEAYPELSGHLIMLDRARQGLIDTQSDDGEVSKQIEELTAQIARHDETHDRKARAVYGAMTALAERADDPAARNAWLARRDKLFPNALEINSTSFMDEAGNVTQVRARITPELRAVLEQTDIAGQPLSDTVDAWLAAGEALGEAVTERSRLKNTDDDERISASDVREARYFWINAVDGFVTYLKMIDMDDETRTKLLSPLEEAIAAAKAGEAPDDEEVVIDDDGVDEGEDVVIEEPV
jgi:type VI protein secretion system component VasF